MSRTFEFAKLGEVIDGIQTVAFWRQDARPNDPKPEGALMKERTITRPQEQTGSYVDPETGETMPEYSVVPDKYLKWQDSHLTPMLTQERESIDAAEDAAYVETNRELWEFHNAFLSLCDTLTGSTSHAKLDDAQAEAALLALAAIDQTLAAAMSDKLILARMKGIQHYGADWFDDVEWHPEVA